MLMKAQGCLRGRATSPQAGALKLDESQKIRNKWCEPEDAGQKIKISGASQEIENNEIENNEIKNGVRGLIPR